MADVHIVSSLSGGGILSWAVKKRMLTGEVFAFNEIPGTGPLDDGKKRMAFLRSLNFNAANWPVNLRISHPVLNC